MCLFVLGWCAGWAALVLLAVVVTFWPEKPREQKSAGGCGVPGCDQLFGHWRPADRDCGANEVSATKSPPDTTAQRETEKEQK